MKKKETFKATTSRGTELEVIIKIKDEGYGSYELYDEETKGERVYAEGGLWFREKYLIDYDGVGTLPDYIMEKLEEMEYSMDQL
jgi:hypothetical protein